MENEFNFNEFVENLVIGAMNNSPEIQDVLERLDCLNDDVENLDERLGKVEDSTYGLDDLDQRVSDLEDNSANFFEMEDLEKDVEDLQERLAKFEEYLPILEALRKASPVKKPLPAPKRSEALDRHRERFERLAADDLSETRGNRINWSR